MSTPQPIIVATYNGYQDATAEAIVEAMGGILVHVVNEDAAKTLSFDRLLLLGGGDIDPARYGQPKSKYCGTPQPVRDAVELTLARRAAERRIPTLGICRGVQVIAVAHGGTLVQDLPGTPVYHMMAPHHVRTRQDYGLPGYVVNSFHHQAVDQVPDGFEAIAWTSDGVIEAIWSERLLQHGVQWHPELLAEDNTEWLQSFRWWFGAFLELAPMEPVRWPKKWARQEPSWWRKPFRKRKGTSQTTATDMALTADLTDEYLQSRQTALDAEWNASEDKRWIEIVSRWRTGDNTVPTDSIIQHVEEHRVNDTR